MKIYRFFFSNLGWYRIRSKYKLSLFQYIHCACAWKWSTAQEMKKTFWEFSHSNGELLKFDQRIVSKLLGGIDARWNTRTRPSFFFPENGSFSVVLFHTRFYRILKSGRTFQKKIYFTIQFSLVIADILSILRSDIEINVWVNISKFSKSRFTIHFAYCNSRKFSRAKIVKILIFNKKK